METEKASIASPTPSNMLLQINKKYLCIFLLSVFDTVHTCGHELALTNMYE